MKTGVIRISRFFWTLFFLLMPLLLMAQPTKKDTVVNRSSIFEKNAIKLNIDCRRCNYGYIKTHISFVDFVRDQSDADVYLMINTAQTASGGREYTLKFLGRHRYVGENDTLKYVSYQTDTRDAIRKGLLDKIEIGLMRYVAQTKLSRFITIRYRQKGKIGQEASNDQWNHWVFNIGAGSHFSGEKTQKELSLHGDMSAERITNAWKIRFRVNGDYNRSKYEFSGDSSETVYRNSMNYNGLIAKSLSPHWSLGLYSNFSSSTYNNIDYSIGGSPALEYNIFPYSEYTEHELSIRYTITPYYSKYAQETIYLKTSDLLLQEALSVHFSLTQPWGSVNSDVRGSHYFYDFTKNRVDFHLSFDIHVFKGLSVNLYGRYSLINDQLSLAAGTATTSDVLLNLRQQATSYAYGTFIGLNYTFGSIYNNIVNPRF